MSRVKGTLTLPTIVLVMGFKGQVIDWKILPKLMTIKTDLVRSTAAVDNTNYFEKRIPFLSNMVWIVFHPKTFETEKGFMHDFLSQNSESWCPFANAAASDAVGTRCHLAKQGWI